VSVLPPFSNSDHNQVAFKIFVEPTVIKGTCKMKESMVRCWKAADFDGMGRYLSSVDWDTLFTVNFTAGTIWKAFSDILDHAIVS